MVRTAGQSTRLAVLLSGGGRSLQNFLDRIGAGTLDARVVLVIADRRDAYGLTRAARAGIPYRVEQDASRIFEAVREARADLVCLAGYLRLLAPIPSDFAGRVLNIHPSLLPAHGGKGYYGDRVHRAVLASGDDSSGCTVHICNEEYDRGPVVEQTRVPVRSNDDVASLAARVFEAECETYPRAIQTVRNRLDQAAIHPSAAIDQSSS